MQEEEGQGCSKWHDNNLCENEGGDNWFLIVISTIMITMIFVRMWRLPKRMKQEKLKIGLGYAICLLVQAEFLRILEVLMQYNLIKDLHNK